MRGKAPIFHPLTQAAALYLNQVEFYEPHMCTGFYESYFDGIT